MKSVLLPVLLCCCSTLADAVDVSGHYTDLLFASTDSRQQQGVSNLSRLRLDVEAVRGPWSGNVVYDHELLWGNLVRDPLVSRQLRAPVPAWLDATAIISQQQSHYWRHTLYRGWLQYDSEQFRLTAGRQRIAWGSGRMWNPTDRFNPVQPTVLEPDQKLGVDALDAAWRYSSTGSVELVLAPGRMATATEHKQALRWRDTVNDVDIAGMIARIGRETVLGLDATGDWLDAGWRLEWMQSDGPAKAYGQLSVGVDYTWQNSLFPAGLYLAVEYFYNGSPGIAPTASRLQSSSSRLLGIMAGYDLSALWRFDLLLIQDLKQVSWFVSPALSWSATEDLSLKFFGQLPGGRGAGEFGTVTPVYALQADYYF